MVRDGARAPPHHEGLIPLHVMARQHFAHGIDEPGLVDLVLGLGLLLQILFAVLDLGKTGAKDEILDLDLAVCPFVRPLDDRAGRVSPVGIFHLLANAVFWISEIQLGSDIRIAKRRNHLLIVGDFSSEYRDDDRAECRLGVELAEHRQRSLQARHADGKSRRRYRLAAEARDKTVIAATATDGAEADGAAFFVLGFEREFNLVDRAGVVFEAAHDRLVDANPIATISSVLTKILDLKKLLAAFLEAGIDS